MGVNIGSSPESGAGLVLFTIYLNDLLSVPKDCKSICYLDHSKLYLSLPSSTVSKVINNLNMDLENVTFCKLSNVCMHLSVTTVVITLQQSSRPRGPGDR